MLTGSHLNLWFKGENGLRRTRGVLPCIPIDPAKRETAYVLLADEERTVGFQY
mgnify:CR=1 FL=1